MRLRYALISLIVIALIAAGGWYFFVAKPKSSTTAPASTTPSSSQTTPSGSQPSGTNQPSQATPVAYPVSVYFSKHPESDDDPGRTFALKRNSPDLGVAKFAISEILNGPTATEANQGYFTTAALRDATSVCDGADFTIVIKDGTATLKFCKPFDHRGVVADGQASSELTATLKQFSSVKKVVILNWQNNCEFDLSGLNKCLE